MIETAGFHEVDEKPGLLLSREYLRNDLTGSIYRISRNTEHSNEIKRFAALIC